MIRVLNFSTHNEDCGIGKYQEDFVREFADRKDIVSDFYPTSPNVIRKLSGRALDEELGRLREQLSSYDILHIQHEYGLFRNEGDGLADIISVAKDLDKKIVITIHTAPSLLYKPAVRHGMMPRSWAGYMRRKLRNKKIMTRKLKPLTQADLVVTLNTNTTNELVNIVGVNQDKIHQAVIPLQLRDYFAAGKTLLREKMTADKTDVILATIGFMNEHKGIEAAIKALCYLPSNYKLAILGGINPASGNPKLYDKLCDLIVERELESRVYISGYIPNDDDLNSLVSGVDVALYPYDPTYYKLASSAAINTALNNRIPVVAYPTPSFIELSQREPGVIAITNSPNYYELVKAVTALDKEHQSEKLMRYAEKYNLTNISRELLAEYKKLV